jgi:hypothetical protein
MSPTMNQSQSPMGLNQIQDFALNFVYNFCSIVTMPVEMALRPQYGSRYFQPMVMFLSAMLMVFLPMFFTFAAAVGQMIPFARFRGPVGLIGMWGISRLFFLGALIHGVRVWRLMLTPAREIHSYYEGPALPFFRRLPWSFWVTRIIAEPAFLFALSIFLPNFFILEPGAAHYLALCAIMLAMKNYIVWFKFWSIIRDILDQRSFGPIMQRLIEDRATPDEMARVHLASFPKNLPDDVRREAAIHIASVFAAQAKAQQSPTREADSSVAQAPHQGPTNPEQR